MAGWQTAAQGFQEQLEGEFDPAAPTPCPDWDAAALVGHVVDTTRRVLARADGSEPVQLGPDDDPVAAYPAARAEVEAALRTHGDAEVDVFGQPGTFGQLVETLLLADTLLHTWDLCRALGNDPRLDPEAVSTTLAFLTPMGEAMRRPGGFGPQVEVPAGAIEQDRLVGFCGRDPAWAPPAS